MEGVYKARIQNIFAVKMEIADTSITSTFLDDHFSNIYENVLSLNVPIVSIPDFLRRIHRTSLLRYVHNVMDIPYHEKEKLLDPLIEYVLSLDVSNPEALEKATIDLKKRLENNPRYGRYFERLEKMFKSLTPRDQIYVLKMSITKTKTKVESIRFMVNDQIIKEKNPIELVLLDQILYSIQEFCDTLLSKLDNPKKKSRPNEIGIILSLMLKVEAVRRGKITMRSMEDDIALSSIFVRPKHVLITRDIAEPVLALLGE